MELQAHRELFKGLGENLEKTSFLGLWDKSLMLYGGGAWSLLEYEDAPDAESDCIVMRLNPHLRVLADGFSLNKPSSSVQFQLFPAQGIAKESKISGRKNP